jgi:oxaloacetate decarboxylase gamma subunit
MFDCAWKFRQIAVPQQTFAACQRHANGSQADGPGRRSRRIVIIRNVEISTLRLKSVHESLVQQAIELMMVGMTTVFVFLILLVFATSLMSSLVRRLAPAPPAGDELTIAAIAGAIRMHRARGR